MLAVVTVVSVLAPDGFVTKIKFKNWRQKHLKQANKWFCSAILVQLYILIANIPTSSILDPSFNHVSLVLLSTGSLRNVLSAGFKLRIL